MIDILNDMKKTLITQRKETWSTSNSRNRKINNNYNDYNF